MESSNKFICHVRIGAGAEIRGLTWIGAGQQLCSMAIRVSPTEPAVCDDDFCKAKIVEALSELLGGEPRIQGRGNLGLFNNA
jgi:hypothetical protein